MVDNTPDWARDPAPQQSQVPAWAQDSAPPRRRPAATGLSAIGETFHDLITPGPADHDPNAIEQGIMDVNNNPLIRSSRATYQQAVMTGPFAQPVRQTMESLGVGMRNLQAQNPGQSEEWYRSHLHAAYNNAITVARQNATNEANAAQVHGSPNIESLISGKPAPMTLGDRALRVAQQGMNIGANIVANPEYFLLPGMGVGNSVATRIGAAALGNAGVGFAADGAAQLMDQAEGMQKSFDVKRNLEATITSGLFGGALHGAVEVAPFVAGLFNKRGVDTTPGGDPFSSNISPMTGDHVAMNQADSMQYRNLLQHGSVDDIKGFFQGRNGPQPNWQEVNQWVEHRDGQHPVTVNGQPGGPNEAMRPSFDYEGEYNQHVEQNYNAQNRQAVQDHVSNVTAGWKNAPEFEVVHGPEHIEDPEIRAQAMKEDAKGDALGFLGSDGKVRMFSGRITDPNTANAVIFHESLGHHGLAVKFGDRLDQVIQNLLDRNVNQFSKRVDAWQKANPKAYSGDRVRAAEEVLAEDSQNGQIKSSWQQAVTSAVRQFGRKMGLKLAYSDAEINHILAMAHDAVINGKPSAAANGFRGAKQDPNKFMYTGARSRAGISATSFEGADGNFRNEISDHQASMRPAWDQLPEGKSFDVAGTNQSSTLGEVLDHPDLYEQYPHMRDIRVTKTPGFMDFFDSVQGSWDRNRETININPRARDPLSTILHEGQHVIQDYEGWSGGGNQNSVKLTDTSALRKLIIHMGRKIDQNKTRFAELAADHPGIVREDGGSVTRDWEQVRDQAQELMNDEHPLRQAMAREDSLQQKYDDLKKQVSGVREEIESKYQKDVDAYKEQRDKINDEGTRLTNERMKAIAEKDYTLAHELHVKIMENINERSQLKHPLFDLKGVEERQAPLEAKALKTYQSLKYAKDQVREQVRPYQELKHQLYRMIAGEREARDVQARQKLSPSQRELIEHYSHEGIDNDVVIHVDDGASQDALGREPTNPDELDQIDRLKADPRFWSDPEYRKNVIELARSQQPIDRTTKSDLPPPSKYASEAEARAAQNKYMTSSQFDEEKPLPFTQDDVIMNRRLRAALRRHANPNDLNPKMSPEEHEATLERLAREHGDVPNEIYDNVAQAWGQAARGREGVKNPKLAEEIYVYDTSIRTPSSPHGMTVRSFPNRRDALRWIDEQPNQQDLGIDRLGTDNKYITRSQIAAEPDYKAKDLEGIYNALDEGYTPTTRSFDEERKAALAAGFSPAQIKALKETNPGDLSTRLYRLQSAANMADSRIAELNEKLDTPDWSAKDQAEYIRVLADRNYLVTRIKGERAEIARALNVSKAASSYNVSTMEQMRELLEQGGSGLAGLAADPTAFLKFARSVKQMMANGNPAGAQQLMQNVNKPYWEQYLNTFHMNMMLSALSTHVKAPMDMATGISRDVIERILAIPVGKLREMTMGALGRQAGLGVRPEEVAGNIYGIIKSVTDAEVYKRVAHAAKTGEGGWVDPNGKAVPTNFMNQFGATSNPRIPVVSKPTDLISAQDTFFRSVAMNQNLYSLGMREAREQLGPKASWDDVMTLGSNLARSPTPSMLSEASDLANRTLLLNHNPLNNIIDKWRSYRPGLTPWERVGRFVVSNLAPFIRVESNNLINRVIQRSPLAFLDPYTIGQLKAGGAKADIALTKIIYGTTLMGISWMAADKTKNYLQGEGPQSVDKFKEAQAAGFTPRSVHENGRYNVANSLSLSLNPLDQHNATATMVASMREAYEMGANKGQVGTGLKLALSTMMHDLSEMSWVSDIAPAVDALTAHGQEGQSAVSAFVSNEARTWVPNIVNQVGRLHDPVRRDTNPADEGSLSERTLNELQSTIPGLRERLPIKYSVYGNPLQNGASLTGVHTTIPGLEGNGTTETRDPAEMELNRLGTMIPSALVTPVQRTITLEDGNKRKLKPAEFEEYQRLAGRAIVETVRSEMSTPAWQNMSDQEKVLEVRSIQTDMKKAAREALFNQ